MLFRHALTLVEEIRTHGTSTPFWTFGGGTVLMLRYGHRLSKDVDIFVPNPQYLGYVNPRINETASEITTDYDEHAGFVKLILPEGEIDFVVSQNLTAPGYDEWVLMDQPVKVETAAEIVAKKMWYRGDRPTARDLFDLSLVIERESDNLMVAGAYLVRHRETFLRLLVEHRTFLLARFNDIETLGFTPSFDYCVGLAKEFLAALPKASAQN
ncbi:nucleotidyl transferase AbiEii/AbiGii toxin family protein [Paraburkholderia sp. RG36]|uniref:Nucleotidyl transferase AbiEii/AbiGii toxin family protein n=2 Tax=Paraburkholderia tagetis TaxID=2913261 RepID=A0A9X1UF80_9BURK|nr:nucleotidyl transferase AbiEii/AbiGii toxin family protein [Paraburkholderia tagetis]